MLVVQRLLNENRKLFSENSSLRHQVGDLTTQCTNLHNQLNSIQCQLALLVAVPQHCQNPTRVWHEQARTRVDAGDSRSAPTHAYNCI